MALKPDVTLSIAKNVKETEGTQKLYYNENVYRARKGGNEFSKKLCRQDLNVWVK